MGFLRDILALHIQFILVYVAAQNSDTDPECAPQIANKCFNNFLAAIYDASHKSYDDNLFCNSLEDRMSCSKDVIDGGCLAEEGSENFDRWMDGMMSVQHYLCYNSRSSLKELLRGFEPYENCLNLTQYLSCIESKTRITHIADMLYVRLDSTECNWVLLSFATCGSQSSSPECSHLQDTLNEVVHIFIQNSKCSTLCSAADGRTHSITLMSTIIILYIYYSI